MGWNLLAECQNTDQSHLLLLLLLPERSASQRILTFPFFPPAELPLSAAVSHKSEGFLTPEVYWYVLLSTSTADNLLFNTTHYIRILRSCRQTLFLTVCVQVGGVSNRKTRQLLSWQPVCTKYWSLAVLHWWTFIKGSTNIVFKSWETS